MIEEVLKDELCQKKLNLNNHILKDSCFRLGEIIKKIPDRFENHLGIGTGADSSKPWEVYNTFLFPYPQFHDLFNAIRDTFHEAKVIDNKKYYIQSWTNLFYKGECIGWHSHNQSEYCEYMTGYYCVDAEPSVTTHRFIDTNVDYNHENKNGYVVFTKMGKKHRHSIHRTWPWPYEDRPRITIAFEILSEEGIFEKYPNEMYNHWIPL